MPTYQYKKVARQQEFVDAQQNSPSAPRKDKYDVGETEDITGVSMISPLGKDVSLGEYHDSRGAAGGGIEGGMGWKIVNKVTGGRFKKY